MDPSSPTTTSTRIVSATTWAYTRRGRTGGSAATGADPADSTDHGAPEGAVVVMPAPRQSSLLWSSDP
jgi:hypothetical protein